MGSCHSNNRMREIIFLLLLSLFLSLASARYTRKGKGKGRGESGSWESGSEESSSLESGSEESGESGSNESSGGSEESSVIKIDLEDTMLKCAANTFLENRLKIAFTTCSAFGKDPISTASVRRRKSRKGKGGKRGKNGRKGKKGKGKNGKGKKCKKGKCGGKKCPSVGEWIEKVNKRSLKDNCLYNSLGWIDDNNDLKVAQILVDAASLPVSVLADFTDASLQQCTETLVEKWQSRPKRKSCGESLSSSDNDLLIAAELLAAGKKCVKTILKESCYTAISTTLLVETSGSQMPVHPQPIEDGIYDMIPVEPGYGGGAGGYVPDGYVDPLPGWISPPGYGYDHFPGHIPNHEIHIIHHIEYPEHESLDMAMDMDKAMDMVLFSHFSLL